MNKRNPWKITRFIIYLLLFSIIVYVYSKNGYEQFTSEEWFPWFIHPIFFVTMLIELGYFFQKNIPEFLRSTLFLEKVEEKSRIGMFFLNLFSTIIALLSAFWPDFEDYTNGPLIFLIGLSSVMYVFVSKAISSWNYPIREWFQSSLDGVYYNFILFFASLNIVFLTGLLYDSERYLRRVQNWIFFFLILLVWMMFWFFWSYFDKFAKEYELRFRRQYFAQSKESEAICSHCHTPLTEVMIHALALSDVVYCIHCGGKIMKNEVFSPSEKDILREHNEIIQKFENKTYEDEFNSIGVPTKKIE